MSADVDPEDKTEEPTEKRLHDAVERGEVAFSREAPLFASLCATGMLPERVLDLAVKTIAAVLVRWRPRTSPGLESSGGATIG
jgi:flagellar biosynthetic protein FlhB